MFAKNCFITIAALLAAVNVASACSCIPFEEINFHANCPGRFLSVLTITNVTHEFSTLKYNYQVIADYTTKMEEKTPMSEHQILLSADNGALCGVTLEKGQTYLLFGTVQKHLFPRVALCGSIAKKLDHIPTADEAEKMMEEVFKVRCVEK